MNVSAANKPKKVDKKTASPSKATPPAPAPEPAPTSPKPRKAVRPKPVVEEADDDEEEDVPFDDDDDEDDEPLDVDRIANGRGNVADAIMDMEAEDRGPRTTPIAPISRTMKQRAEDIAVSIKAVSDRTRIGILWLLLEATDRMCVADIMESVEMYQSAISHHLALLRHANLVRARRDGCRSWYVLTDKGRIMAEMIRKIDDPEHDP